VVLVVVEIMVVVVELVVIELLLDYQFQQQLIQ